MVQTCETACAYVENMGHCLWTQNEAGPCIAALRAQKRMFTFAHGCFDGGHWKQCSEAWIMIDTGHSDPLGLLCLCVRTSLWYATRL